MKHDTQMQAARKGLITKEMERAAAKEGMPAEDLRELIAAGHAVIPANRRHISLDPYAIGRGLRTKINVNIGVSRDCYDPENELAKARKAVEMKAEALMDLSSFGRTQDFRRRLIAESPMIIGTVPIYDILGCGRDLNELTAADFLRMVETHAEDGVDFLTIHAGINRATAAEFKRNPRVTNIVSRGGSLLFAWMEITGNENPFYEHFDRVLDICAAHDVTISLGDACRPGSISDATDASQIQELIALGELTLKAWERGIQVIIEGPGHIPLNEVAANVLLAKKLCHNAPFYVLGPLVTDVAPGYDHITSAIGGAVAAMSGADFLCYVTPAEHLRLPTMEDMVEGIAATKIAAHAADIAKGISGAREWDLEMSRARAALDWEEMFRLALEPEKARSYRAESTPADPESCTMCGKVCAVRTLNRVLGRTDLNL